MATYYFSTSGNDSNNGLSSGSPFQTLTKFNTIIGTGGIVAPGDTILFNRGDVFQGSIIIGKSGTSSLPITIGVYGTGNKPIITGLTTISSWTSLGGGIYESTSSISSLTTCNMVTIDDTPYAMGRYPKITAPNKGYLTYQSHSGQTSITSNAISSAPNFVGGEIVIRPIRHILDRCVITAQTSTTVSYTSVSSYVPNDGYGFFFQNHPNCVTQFGDWYYNPSTKKLRVHFGGGVPGTYTVKASTEDILVSAIGRSYVSFNNISFQGANTKIFKFDGSNHISTIGCEELYAGQDAVTALSASFITIDNNLINWSNDNGIYLNLPTQDTTSGKTVTSHTITNNTITNTGTFPGMGRSGDVKYMGIAIYGGNNTVQNNTITKTGYCPIYFVWGDNSLIKNNIISDFCSVKNDGGGIYTYNGNTNPLSFTGQRITGNIIYDAKTSNEGTIYTSGGSQGIYLDNNVAGVEIDSNVVFGTNRGIFGHDANSLNIHNNTLYNNWESQINLTYDNAANPAMTGMQVNNNVFFAYDSTQLVALYQSLTNDISSWGTFNNNYYCRPISEPKGINSTSSTVGGIIKVIIPSTKYYSLDAWKSTYAPHDSASFKTAFPISNTSELRFEYNLTSSSPVISITGNTYSGVDGEAYSDSVTLTPYSSLIMIEDDFSTEDKLKISTTYFDSGNGLWNITCPTNKGVGEIAVVQNTNTLANKVFSTTIDRYAFKGSSIAFEDISFNTLSGSAPVFSRIDIEYLREIPTKYGIEIEISAMSTSDRVAMINTMGALYYRDGMTVYDWPHGFAAYTSAINNGTKVLLNLKWKPQTGAPAFPIGADLTSYISKATNILDTIPAPELVVIENEEINTSFHSGPMSDYVAMLQFMEPVVHSRGLKMSNGGVYGQGLDTLVYRWTKTNYGLSAADGYAAVTMTQFQRNSALNGGNAGFEDDAAKVQTVLNGCALYCDYVNVHYYEVKNPNSTNPSLHIEATKGALLRIREFILATTGKPVLTNEINTRDSNTEPLLMRSFLQEVRDNGFSYCLYVLSEDGNAFGGVPVCNSTSPFALRSNGEELQDYITTHT